MTQGGLRGAKSSEPGAVFVSEFSRVSDSGVQLVGLWAERDRGGCNDDIELEQLKC